MKKLLPALAPFALLFALVACAPPADNSGSSQGDAPGEEQTQAFAGVTQLSVTGYLQHIEVRAAKGEEVVIRWTGDGSETATQRDGRVDFSFAEPDWLDGPSPPDGAPRFRVVSTLYVELPADMDTAAFTSTLGDITLEGPLPYHTLTAETVDGDVTARGIAGEVLAETNRGTIGPAALPGDITYSEYDGVIYSQELRATLLGAASPAQNTRLYTESGAISINE